MNERLEAIKSSILDSLEKAKTALNNKDVKVESLKVSEIPDYIRQIELNKYTLTVNCSEFESGTIKATKDGKERTGIVEGGKAVIRLPSTGTWHIEHDLGDYVETEVNDFESSCELVKKKVTFTEGDCTEDKIVVHIQSVVGNNSNDNFIRVKKNGTIIEVQAQLKGSDIEITNFEYEEGATYTIEYVLKDEVRGSIEVEILGNIGKSVELNNVNFICPDAIDSNSITKIKFTDEKAPLDVTTYDVSKSRDNGVAVWEKDGTLYCSTQKQGKKVKLFNTMGSNQYRIAPFYNGFAAGMGTGSIKKFSNNLTCIDFEMADTSDVTDMSYYFYQMKGLIEVPNIEKLDVSSVTSMNRMFCQASALQSLNLNEWNTEHLSDCQYMLSDCKQLNNINLESWICSNLTTAAGMFSDCSKLKSVNLKNLNPTNFKNGDRLFYGCSELTTIDLSSLNSVAEASFTYGFRDCSNLTTIYAQEWNLTEGYLGMFDNCSSLPNYNKSNPSEQMVKWKENGGYFTNPAEKLS